MRRGVLPNLELPTTAGGTRNLRELATHGGHKVVLFFYPRTGIPGEPPALRDGLQWDQLPGARGCTPQSCGFRDLYAEFKAKGIDVYGVSTSTPEHQLEFVRRNHIPFEMLSDHRLEFTRAMKLPTFEWPVESGGPSTLIRRMAWYVERYTSGECRIQKVWYPVFPPDRCALTVHEWLVRHGELGLYGSEEVNPRVLREALLSEFHSTTIESRGKSFDVLNLTMYVAMRGGQFEGLITMKYDPGELEVVTLQSINKGRGVGSFLLNAAEALGRSRGCRRLFLTTSNDNLHALAFYQHLGWRIVGVHKNAINEARKRNPTLPVVGASGILSQDEIELELVL